jgi:hypothetical protein
LVALLFFILVVVEVLLNQQQQAVQEVLVLAVQALQTMVRLVLAQQIEVAAVAVQTV